MNEKIQVPIYFEVKNYDKLLDKLNKLSEIQDKLSLASFGDNVEKISQAFDTMKAQARSSQDAVEKLNKALSETDIGKITKEAKKDTSTSFKGMEIGLEKSFGFAKKLGYALLTVRGVWFAIRKAMSSYLSQNEELQNKLNGIYYAVGSMFAPILEWLVNQLVEIIGYVDYFVKALGFAGMNMSKLEQNTKKANKALAPFDELTNLSSNEDSKYSNPFENLVLNDNILNWLDDIAKVGRNALEVISGLFTKIKGTIGISFNEKLEIDKVSFQNQISDALTRMLGFYIGWSVGNTLTGKLLTAVTISTIFSFSKAIIEKSNESLNSELLKSVLAGALGIAVGLLTGNFAIGFKVFSSVKLILDIVLGNKDEIKNKITQSTSILDNFSASGSLNNIVVKSENVLPEYEINKNKKHLTALASYDVGTNYVPNDQLAYIHKGEAIIPAKYNDGTYGNGNVVAKLDQLISVVDSKEFKAYISQSDIGKASLGYINQQNKIIGGGLI